MKIDSGLLTWVRHETLVDQDDPKLHRELHIRFAALCKESSSAVGRHKRRSAQLALTLKSIGHHWPTLSCA
ncbi:MAG: hypothetical protein WCN85_04435, partial [Burkholderiales bacterium]